MITQHTRSTDFLRLLGEDPSRYLLLERAVPRGCLKRDMVTLKQGDGRDVEVVTSSGYRCSPLEVPIVILNDFLRESIVRQDGADDGGSTIFRLTTVGIEHARS